MKPEQNRSVKVKVKHKVTQTTSDQLNGYKILKMLSFIHCKTLKVDFTL